MGTVGIGFSMSLDGFIAQPNDEVGPLFDWYNTPGATGEINIGGETTIVSAEGAALVEEAGRTAGVLLTGRKLFDITHGWGGRHPMNVPIVVLSHRPAPEWVTADSIFTFMDDSIENAIAKARAIAGEKTVAIASANVAQQAFRAGLVDEIHIDLVPILLSEGIRLFDHIGANHIRLEHVSATQSPNVTHMTFRVVR